MSEWRKGMLHDERFRKVKEYDKMKIENEKFLKNLKSKEYELRYAEDEMRRVTRENEQLKLELKEQKAEFGDWFNYPKSCQKLITENEMLKITIIKLKDELDNPQTTLSNTVEDGKK